LFIAGGGRCSVPPSRCSVPPSRKLLRDLRCGWLGSSRLGASLRHLASPWPGHMEVGGRCRRAWRNLLGHRSFITVLQHKLHQGHISSLPPMGRAAVSSRVGLLGVPSVRR
jgi:hypothetical protein